ncbi:SMI1/KNR4 family protein [Heyndrickxia sporothermodurans]|nr:SMI1/KNR4 family protein [Heyndrickxia sporothermodurans]MEB6551355.1 SMI1/KNR4 family protein [Heyndrickxia sporothermodurans]
MTRIQEVLDKLKSQLDENSTRLNPKGLLDEDDKDILREECIFEEPATEEDVKSLETELGITIPNDYKEFLLLHNGMTLFSSYLVEYKFFSLNEIREHFPIVQEGRKELDLKPNKDYPIGEFPDVGYIIMDSKKIKNRSSEGAIYVNHLSPEQTKESFVSFVQKLIENPGDFFWEDSSLKEY